jgi:cell wall-associated NlpC family hydrolase
LETWWGEGAEARTGAWAADLDVRLAPGNSSGVAPSFFAGIGLEGARDVTDDMRVAPNWSAGGGLAYAPLRWFRLESEVRYRVPFGGPASAPDPIASAGFEYRVGVAVVVRNARSGPARPAAAPVVRRDPARWPTPRTSDERAAVAADILDTADDHLGTRYLWGGSSPSTGFDCSGFLQHVFAAHGLHIPRVSQDQARAGQSIGSDPAGWVPGDLLFFASNGRTVDHAALYAGGGRIIHSSESGSGVRYDDLSTPRGEWYRRHLVGVRRVF